MINKSLFVVSIILFAVLTRFLPHPPNFTPIAAIAISSLLLSDLFLGLHATIPFVYASFVLIALLGLSVKKMGLGIVLLSSTIFFLVSNFGVWFLHYPLSIEGFIQCYTLALPFFLNTILGDLVYCALLIYPFYALQKRNLLSF